MTEKFEHKANVSINGAGYEILFTEDDGKSYGECNTFDKKIIVKMVITKDKRATRLNEDIIHKVLMHEIGYAYVYETPTLDNSVKEMGANIFEASLNYVDNIRAIANRAILSFYNYSVKKNEQQKGEQQNDTNTKMAELQNKNTFTLQQKPLQDNKVSLTSLASSVYEGTMVNDDKSKYKLDITIKNLDNVNNLLEMLNVLDVPEHIFNESKDKINLKSWKTHIIDSVHSLFDLIGGGEWLDYDDTDEDLIS